MSIYEPVLVVLDGVINEFKDEFKRANTTVEELCFLQGYEMNQLLKSNIRATAALTVKETITEAKGEKDAEVTRTVEHLLNEAVKVANYPVIKLYEQVLKLVRQSSAS